MSVGLIIVCFMFTCGCLAGIAVCIKEGQFVPAGIVGVLLVAGLLLFSSAYSPHADQAEKINDLRKEILSLKEEMKNLNPNNPAELAAVCLVGACALVAAVFFGIYGLVYLQAVIRRAEHADRAGCLPAVSGPEPVRALPEGPENGPYGAAAWHQG